jgi:transposase
MTSDDLAFLPLKVIRTGPGGKQRLIEACLQPGISISGMALKAGINANQLRKWLLQARRQAPLAAVSHPCAPLPAFLPVRQVDAVASLPPQRHGVVPTSSLAPVRLSARLPNGVTVELECTAHDAALVTAMITALGAH